MNCDFECTTKFDNFLLFFSVYFLIEGILIFFYFRTFQGLTCLMQISSRRKDYVIDTLTLRRSMHLLGVIFDNPAVVKVPRSGDSCIFF